MISSTCPGAGTEKLIVVVGLNGFGRFCSRLKTTLDGRSPIPIGVPVNVTSGIPASVVTNPGVEATTVHDLLRMSSGLRFTGHHDPDYSPNTDYPDHFWIYTGAVDAVQWSVAKPLAAAPNSVGRYHNSDPLIATGIVRLVTGDTYLAFPQKALFDRVGIRRQVLETDPYGNFLITGFDYGTPRNWARLGMLCLQDGMWQGERILPEGFVDFMRAPAPAWDEPEYGGLVWLNLTGKQNLPDDAYYFAGAGGQYTFIVPSLDLVFVRMGHTGGYTPDMLEHLRRAQGEIVAAVSAPFD